MALAHPPLPQLLDLTGQSAVVTGAGRGIGRAIAARLAEAGAGVVVADLHEETARAAAASIADAGGRAVAVPADVAREPEVERMVATAVDRFGGLDLLVNNAGVFPMRPFADVDAATWNRTLEVNLTGAFLCAKAAAPRLAERGGSIVNVASIDAFHPTGNLVHYDASKGGMVMMTKSLALELAPRRVRVNAVAPGGVATEGAAEASAATVASLAARGMSPDEIRRAFTARVPLGRMGEADEIARVVLFLASPLAAYVTGTTVVADGGYLLS